MWGFVIQGSDMGDYTVLIEAGDSEGEQWHPVAPPQATIGDSAAEVARWTAVNQDVAEGHWRVRVWDGRHGDTNADPAAEVYSNTL